MPTGPLVTARLQENVTICCEHTASHASRESRLAVATTSHFCPGFRDAFPIHPPDASATCQSFFDPCSTTTNGQWRRFYHIRCVLRCECRCDCHEAIEKNHSHLALMILHEEY
mmetsp:Transcript_62259/g.119974  ORF Transcript_62259/g.119974 Transcript_62259/m.119974 type:complete len:113 (+) Transcript_62259:45-383(+)